MEVNFEYISKSGLYTLDVTYSIQQVYADSSGHSGNCQKSVKHVTTLYAQSGPEKQPPFVNILEVPKSKRLQSKDCPPKHEQCKRNSQSYALASTYCSSHGNSAVYMIKNKICDNRAYSECCIDSYSLPSKGLLPLSFFFLVLCSAILGFFLAVVKVCFEKMYAVLKMHACGKTICGFHSDVENKNQIS